MDSDSLLSTQVSKARSLLLSGSLSYEVQQIFQKWNLKVSTSARGHFPEKLLEWNRTLCEVCKSATDLGFSILPILKEVAPIVRLEEKLWTKLKNYERQFAAQIALVLVLPWACASVSGPFPWGAFSAVGAVLQILGCVFFYFLVRRALVDKNLEESFLFELLLQIHIRLLAGVPLAGAMKIALNQVSGHALSGHTAHSPFSSMNTKDLVQNWQQWCKGLWAFDESHKMEWPTSYARSAEIAATLQEFYLKGAPCTEPLANLIQQLLEERQSRLDLKIGMLPTALSMVICLFLAPAFFLILGENLWPQISAILSPSM
jgi:hypothetical protein